MIGMKELFETVTPFWDSEWCKENEQFKALWDEYAYLDIEILRQVDPEIQALIHRQVEVREKLNAYRDYYYFLQGGDKEIEGLKQNLSQAGALLEKVIEIRQEKKEAPLSE